MPKITNLDQRVELIAADVEDIKANGLGPEPVDAYTKAEADLKFQTIAGMAAYQTTAGMSSYLTSASAAETYQPIGSYLTATDIADMATQTWVGQQGFLTSSDVDEVPSVGSSDNGKVLTAVYNDGVASYSWQTPQVVSYTKAEADQKFQTISGMSSYLTSSDAASTYQPIGSYATASDISDMATQTWVGQQSYLTQSDAASTYLTQSAASSTYLPSATARQVPAPVAADDGKVLTAASNGTYSWETPSAPSVDEVPAVTSSDDGKVLTATYSGGTGSYAWATSSGGDSSLPSSTASDSGKILTVDGYGDPNWYYAFDGNTLAGTLGNFATIKRIIPWGGVAESSVPFDPNTWKSQEFDANPNEDLYPYLINPKIVEAKSDNWYQYVNSLQSDSDWSSSSFNYIYGLYDIKVGLSPLTYDIRDAKVRILTPGEDNSSYSFPEPTGDYLNYGKDYDHEEYCLKTDGVYKFTGTDGKYFLGDWDSSNGTLERMSWDPYAYAQNTKVLVYETDYTMADFKESFEEGSSYPRFRFKVSQSDAQYISGIYFGQDYMSFVESGNSNAVPLNSFQNSMNQWTNYQSQNDYVMEIEFSSSDFSTAKLSDRLYIIKSFDTDHDTRYTRFIKSTGPKTWNKIL